MAYIYRKIEKVAFICFTENKIQAFNTLDFTLSEAIYKHKNNLKRSLASKKFPNSLAVIYNL